MKEELLYSVQCHLNTLISKKMVHILADEICVSILQAKTLCVLNAIIAQLFPDNLKSSKY